jgi:hypothetical protein
MLYAWRAEFSGVEVNGAKSRRVVVDLTLDRRIRQDAFS